MKRIVCSSLLRLSAAIAVWLVASGCGMNFRREWVVSKLEEHNQALRDRASFDLQCAAAELELVPLRETAPFATHPDLKFSRMSGVRGCGKQSTYVYDENRSVWILNTDSRALPRPRPSSPNPNPSPLEGSTSL